MNALCEQSACKSILLSVLLIPLLAACGPESEQPAPLRRTRTESAEARPLHHPHVVLITVSGLRQDRLAAYGAEQSRAPEIDAFARDSAVFTNAWAAESYTLASVGSLFTAQYPHVHRAIYTEPIVHPLSRDSHTLATILRQQGFQTTAIVSGQQISPEYGLNAGFDEYRFVGANAGATPANSNLKLSDTSERIYDITQRLIGIPRAPQFLYLHFGDPQMPATPPQPYATQFASEEVRSRIAALYAQDEPPVFAQDQQEVARALYDGAVACTSHWVGQTLELLASRNITRDNAIIIILADRGQELFDQHGQYFAGADFARSLYSEQVRIPLILSFPGMTFEHQTTFNAPIAMVDVAPTILSLLDLSWDKETATDGVSFKPVLAGSEPGRQIVYIGASHGRGAIVNPHWKYIRLVEDHLIRHAGVLNARGPQQTVFVEELYNRDVDPEEQRNVARFQAERVAQLRQALDEHLGLQASGEAATQPDAEE